MKKEALLKLEREERERNKSFKQLLKKVKTPKKEKK